MSQSIRRALYRAKGLPDPGPTPSVEMTQLTILVERELAKKVDELHEFLIKQFPSRNDLLLELLKEGLRSAAQAALEAERAMQQTKTPDIQMDPPKVHDLTVENVGIPAEERKAISSRLAALRGEG